MEIRHPAGESAQNRFMERSGVRRETGEREPWESGNRFSILRWRAPRMLFWWKPTSRRDGRVVEGARLESVYRGNSIEGSNPSLSAIVESISYEILPVRSVQ